MKTKKKIFRNIIIILLCFAVVGVAVLLIINGHVKSAGKDRILTVEQAAELEDVDCIIVLGCQVKDDGSLSHMLRDRLTETKTRLPVNLYPHTRKTENKNL